MSEACDEGQQIFNKIFWNYKKSSDFNSIKKKLNNQDGNKKKTLPAILFSASGSNHLFAIRLKYSALKILVLMR